MKGLFTSGVVAVLLGMAAAGAQDAARPSPSAQPRVGGRRDPHIVPPRATENLQEPKAPRLPYHFVAAPGPAPGQQFANVSGVALTAQGHLLVYNRNPAMMMLEYDAQGKLLRTFNPNIAVNTHGLRLDRQGNIWITDSFLNVVWKLKPNGEPLMAIGKRGEVAKWDETKWNGTFNQPMDIAFDNDDNFYVVQGHGGTSYPPDCTFCSTYDTANMAVAQGSDARVFKFDKTGKYLTSRSLAHADGMYATIHSVIVTPKGELWVTDRQLGKILVMDANLAPIREIQLPCLTSGLFVDAKGQYWVSAGMDGAIMTIDETGKVTGWLRNAGRDPDGQTSNLIGEAHYITVSPDQKTIYIADTVNAKVLKLEHD